MTLLSHAAALRSKSDCLRPASRIVSSRRIGRLVCDYKTWFKDFFHCFSRSGITISCKTLIFFWKNMSSYDRWNVWVVPTLYKYTELWSAVVQYAVRMLAICKLARKYISEIKRSLWSYDTNSFKTWNKYFVNKEKYSLLLKNVVFRSWKCLCCPIPIVVYGAMQHDCKESHQPCSCPQT